MPLEVDVVLVGFDGTGGFHYDLGDTMVFHSGRSSGVRLLGEILADRCHKQTAPDSVWMGALRPAGPQSHDWALPFSALCFILLCAVKI